MRYKVDVLSALKEAGYSTYRIRKDKIMGESVVQQIRRGEIVSCATLERICTILQCDIGDILTVYPPT